MKKTIKADKKRKILKEEFLNDNALLQATMEENRDVTIGVRFVEHPLVGIKKHILTRLSIYDYMSDYDNLIKIANDSSAVAVFTKTDEGLQLDRLYDAEEHEFALSEFIDIVYEKRFPELALDKHLVLKSTN